MAKTVKAAGGAEKAAPAKKQGGGASGVVLLTSSFALVLTAMMFMTGTAQRTALPRLREMAARMPFVKKPAADSVAVASDTTSVLDRVATQGRAAWSAASDSLAILEERLSLALAEVESSKAPVVEESAGGAVQSGAAAADADPGASRDLARLVKVLDAMKPVEAARILNSVDNDLAIEAIRKLKERQAGKVLALMEPAKAIAVGAALGRGAGGSL